MQAELRNENPHQQDVSENGNQAVREMEANHSADQAFFVGRSLLTPSPSFMPQSGYTQCGCV